GKFLPNKELKMNIFVDTSYVELFFNDGWTVLSSIAFPEEEDTFIFLEMKESHVSTHLIKIKKSIQIETSCKIRSLFLFFSSNVSLLLVVIHFFRKCV